MNKIILRNKNKINSKVNQNHNQIKTKMMKIEETGDQMI